MATELKLRSVPLQTYDLFMKPARLQSHSPVTVGYLAEILLGKGYSALQFSCWCYSGNSPINVTIWFTQDKLAAVFLCSSPWALRFFLSFFYSSFTQASAAWQLHGLLWNRPLQAHRICWTELPSAPKKACGRQAQNLRRLLFCSWKESWKTSRKQRCWE